MKRFLISTFFILTFFKCADAQELIAGFDNLAINGNTFSFDVMLAAGSNYSATTSINNGAASIRFNITDVVQPAGGPQTSVVASEFYPNYTVTGLTSFQGGTVAGSAKFAANIVPGGTDPFLSSTVPVKICRLTVTSPAPIPLTAVMTMRPSTAGSNAAANGGSGFSYLNNANGIITATSSIPLPLELLYFNVKKAGVTSLLSWSITSAPYDRRFCIEHSRDGKAFATIGTVSSAAGFSKGNTRYTYTDFQPVQGINYYRLKQVSNDGKTGYSTTISLVFADPATVIAAPNPATDKITVQGLKSGQMIILSDITGKTVLNYMVSVASEILDVSAMAPGTYILIVYESGNPVHNIKVVKH